MTFLHREAKPGGERASSAPCKGDGVLGPLVTDRLAPLMCL